MILLTGLLFGAMASLFVAAALPGKSSRPAATPRPAATQRRSPRPRRPVADLCTPTRYDSMTSDSYSQGRQLQPLPIIVGDYSDPVEPPTRQRRAQSPATPKPLPAPIVATDWPIMPKVEEEEPVFVPLATGRAARFASLELRKP